MGIVPSALRRCSSLHCVWRGGGDRQLEVERAEPTYHLLAAAELTMVCAEWSLAHLPAIVGVEVADFDRQCGEHLQESATKRFLHCI